MPREFVLSQVRTPGSDKLQIRGVFSQKKKLWEVLSGLSPELDKMWILDDVTGKEAEAKYSTLCNKLRLIGRVTVLTPEKQRQYLIVETERNELRDWDTDDEGKPKLNPTKGDESKDEEAPSESK